jgi:hypothetical protein
MDTFAGGFEREYRKRRRLPWRYLGLVVLVGANAVFRAVQPHYSAPARWLPWVAALAMATAVARILLEQYRAYTRVTDTGITAQWAVRSRIWTWQEAYDIRVEHTPRGSGNAAPQWLAYLYDFEGRRFLLPQMDDWQLDDPYAEVAELCLAAAPYRSLAWERRLEVEERIRRRAGRRKGWKSGFSGALVVLVLMGLVGIWQVSVGFREDTVLELVCVPVATFFLLGALFSWYWTNRVPPATT